jgi:hypothetical protein
MSSILENLKSHLRSYSKIDNELHDLNKKVYDLRAERRDVESHMASILTSPEFAQIDKIQLTEDNSFVKIQRPGWNKPWNITKKELSQSLTSYFSSTSTPTADDCYAYIVQSQRDKLTSTDFNFTRVKND